MGLLLLLGGVLPLKQFTAMGRLLRHRTAQRDNFHKKGKKGKELSRRAGLPPSSHTTGHAGPHPAVR
jgi:hypothetical protein